MARLSAEGDLLRGLVLDWLGSEAVTNVSRQAGLAGRDGRAEGLLPGKMFAPGYKGWDVSGQELIFAAVPASAIGVRLTASFMMTPRKSYSFRINCHQGAGDPARPKGRAWRRGSGTGGRDAATEARTPPGIPGPETSQPRSRRELSARARGISFSPCVRNRRRGGASKASSHRKSPFRSAWAEKPRIFSMRARTGHVWPRMRTGGSPRGSGGRAFPWPGSRRTGWSSRAGRCSGRDAV